MLRGWTFCRSWTCLRSGPSWPGSRPWGPCGAAGRPQHRWLQRSTTANLYISGHVVLDIFVFQHTHTRTHITHTNVHVHMHTQHDPPQYTDKKNTYILQHLFFLMRRLRLFAYSACPKNFRATKTPLKRQGWSNFWYGALQQARPACSNIASMRATSRRAIGDRASLCYPCVSGCLWTIGKYTKAGCWTTMSTRHTCLAVLPPRGWSTLTGTPDKSISQQPFAAGRGQGRVVRLGRE